MGKAQSSINAPWMASMLPACRKTPRDSTLLPAAAAVAPPGLLTQGNGYSIWKKKMKAGIRQRSAKLSQRSLTMSEVSASRSLSARATRARSTSGA
jgi:hypothetical protein